MKYFFILIGFLISTAIFADFEQTPAHGFHWYSKEEDKEEKTSKFITPPPFVEPSEELEKMRRIWRNKLAEAILRPSPDTIYDYRKAQTELAKKTQEFVYFWQRDLLEHPETDYSLNFPTDNSAIALRNSSLNTRIEDTLQLIAKNYGLILFYRSKSNISQQFIQVLLPLMDQYKFAMIAVATDGEGIESLPGSKLISMEVIQQKLNIQERYLPALFLVNLRSQKMSALSYGFMSTTDLKERFLDVATNFQRFTYQGIPE